MLKSSHLLLICLSFHLCDETPRARRLTEGNLYLGLWFQSSILSRVCTAVMKLRDFGSKVCSRSVIEETQDRHLQAGTDAETTEECCCPTAMVCPTCLLESTWDCPKSAGPSHINQQSGKSTTGLSGGGILSTEVPNSKTITAHVKLAQSQPA